MSKQDIKTVVLTQTNKRILWGLLMDNNIFENIPSKYSNNIQNIFEQTIQEVSNNLEEKDNIVEVNKKIIGKMYHELEKYKQSPINKGNNILEDTSNNIGLEPSRGREGITQKQALFQKGLQTKQDEFKNMINANKPETIDFSDKLSDEPIGSEMDSKLAEAIAWREKQLSQVLEKQDTTSATEWISNGQLQNNEVNVNHIKIGDSTAIGEENIINVKKVSFSDSNSNDNINSIKDTSNNILTTNFIDKLKKKDKEETNINNNQNILHTEDVSEIKKMNDIIIQEISFLKNDITQLKETSNLLLENQNKILELLNKTNLQLNN